MRRLLILLVILVSFGSVMAAAPEPITKPNLETCAWITSIGFASEENPGALDPDKVLAMIESGETGYDCFKNILGLWDYEFFFTITDATGNSFEELDTGDQEFLGVYGVYPGKTKDQLIKGFDPSVNLDPVKVLSPPGGGGGISMNAIAPITRTYEPVDNDTIAEEYTTPEFSKFQLVKTFKRVVLMEDADQGFKVVLLTLGVWNWPRA